MAGEPLNILLSRPLLSLTRAYERVDPAAPTLPFYANVLRVIDDDGVEFREFPALARISDSSAFASKFAANFRSSSLMASACGLAMTPPLVAGDPPPAEAVLSEAAHSGCRTS